MTYSKSKIKKLTTALEIYSQLTANKYKETEIQDVEFSSIFEKKMEKLINRQKKPYFYLINTVAKRIAIIIAVIIIANRLIIIIFFKLFLLFFSIFSPSII